MFKTARALHGPKSAHTRTASRSKGQSLGSVRPRLPSFFLFKACIHIYQAKEKHNTVGGAVVAAVVLGHKVAGSNPYLRHIFTFYHLTLLHIV